MNDYNMGEAIIRTEDLDLKDILDYFVETSTDRDNINLLKSRQPMLLVGSRGTGKTMLLRVAEQELRNEFEENRNLPVFVNLATCNIHDSKNLLKVIISRTLKAIQKALKDQGLYVKGSIFKPVVEVDVNPIINELEAYINKTKEDGSDSDNVGAIEVNIPDIKDDITELIDFLDDLTEEFEIKTITFFFDEACQVFQPSHQRIFFDFFRALRSYKLICKASVYPGIQSYGTFQKMHDATIRKVERSITQDDYLEKMKEIIKKHFQSSYHILIRQGKTLNNIIYLSSGNPRFLLKCINEILIKNKNFQTQTVNNVIKEFYGSTIWSEHIKLSEFYTGHKGLLDWARNFIENNVLPDLRKRNDKTKDKTTICFAISRNAPEVIKHSIKTLEYSGIINLYSEGTKYRNEMYDRYEINLGILVLSEKQVDINTRTQEIIDNLGYQHYATYGANSPAYGDYSALQDLINIDVDFNEILNRISKKNISELDLSKTMVEKLYQADINTIEDIISNGETNLMSIRNIGPIRSRRIYNIAYNAVLEYISG